jgi:hypothetical protein
MTATVDDFGAEATTAYAALKEAFPGEDPAYWWRQGHAFDTAIDYLARIDSSDADSFAQLALKYGASPPKDAWYDDYPWWGIAFLKGQLSKGKMGTDLFSQDAIAQFARAGFICWTQVNDNAPYGWDRRADPTKFAAYWPLFEGGVWNHVVDDDCNPGPESPGPLCGRQNTVTNALYLVYATRLYMNDPTSAPFHEAMTREYAFLSNWFAYKDPWQRPDLALMNVYSADKGKAVVRERVGTFRPLPPGNKPGAQDEKYRTDLAWAGDQGLVLGALVDRMRMVPGGSPEYRQVLATARQLLAGTMDYLVDRETDPRGILRAWWPDPAPGGDDDDYLTGPGIFFRSLLYAYRANTELKNDLLQPAAQDFIRANAENVANPDRPQSEDPIVNHANDLATLVAAYGMLLS